MRLESAAALLGVPEREITSVEDSPAGPVISTIDGRSYIVVPDDQPDGAGRTGLMYLSAPHDGYRPDAFPVYTLPAGDDDGDQAASGADDGSDDPAGGATTVDPSKLNKAELIAYATELGVDVDDKMTKADILNALEAAGDGDDDEES